MSAHYDLKDFVANPALLADVCRDVIAAVTASMEGKEVREKEAQLGEIARTIERMQKRGIPVPDALRGEKMRLATEVAGKGDGLAALNALTDALELVVDELRHRLKRDVVAKRGKRENKVRTKQSRFPKTGKDVLCKYVVQALRNLGGRGQVRQVLAEMEKLLKEVLLPGDMEWRPSAKEYVWQNDTRWHYGAMKKAGILRSGTANGIWELTERRS